MRALCHGGLSLVELLVVLAVLGLLLGVSMPGFGTLIVDARRAARVNDLAGVLMHARHASIHHGRPVAVCPSPDGVHCASDWTSGLLVFVVQDGWKTTHPVAEGDRMAWAPRAGSGLVVASNRNRFTFRPYRRRSTNGTIVVCDPRGRAAGRAIVIAPTGRVRTTATLPAWADTHCPPVG